MNDKPVLVTDGFSSLEDEWWSWDEEDEDESLSSEPPLRRELTVSLTPSSRPPFELESSDLESSLEEESSFELEASLALPSSFELASSFLELESSFDGLLSLELLSLLLSFLEVDPELSLESLESL